MTGRIEKIVFISYRRKSSLSTMQPNFSSPQKRIRPHTLSPREPHRGASRRDKPTRQSIVTIRRCTDCPLGRVEVVRSLP